MSIASFPPCHFAPTSSTDGASLTEPSSTSPRSGAHTAITTTNHEHQLHATRCLAHPIRPQLELGLQVLRPKLVWKQFCAMESTREKIHWIGSAIFIVEADEEERRHDGHRRGRGLQGWDLG
jgi:hypothetical protein